MKLLKKSLVKLKLNLLRIISIFAGFYKKQVDGIKFSFSQIYSCSLFLEYRSFYALNKSISHMVKTSIPARKKEEEKIL